MKKFFLQLSCDQINDRGQGQAFDPSTYKPTFADQWLYDEVALLKVIQKKSTYQTAVIEKIINPHPLRINAACPVFSQCGGCHLQHANYALQLDIKKKFLANLLIEFDIDPLVIQPFELSSKPKLWRYRHKLLMPFAQIDGRLESGFFSLDSHALVATDTCLVQTYPLEKLFINTLHQARYLGIKALTNAEPSNDLSYNEDEPRLLYLFARQSSSNDEIYISLVVDKWSEQWIELALRRWQLKIDQFVVSGISVLVQSTKKNEDIALKAIPQTPRDLPKTKNNFLNDEVDFSRILRGQRYHLYGSATLSQSILGLSLESDPLSFFQINPYEAEKVWQKIIDELTARNYLKILELYCGCGALALCLANYGFQVTAVDLDPRAISSAKRQKNNLKLQNVIFEASDSTLFFESYNQVIDALIVNPPRKGLIDSFFESLKFCRPNLIIYMACGQPALARDAKILREYGYTLKQIWPYDFFPQTMHLESLAIFEVTKP